MIIHVDKLVHTKLIKVEQNELKKRRNRGRKKRSQT